MFHRLATLGFGTLLLAALIFFIVPRPGRTAWRGAMLFPKSLVGFSDKITLGQLGEILESHEEVMRVQLTDPQTGRPYPPQPQLYLRGTVLTRYARGQWSKPSAERSLGYRHTHYGHGRRPLHNAAIVDRDLLVPFGGRRVQQFLEHIGAIQPWLSSLQAAWGVTRPGDAGKAPMSPSCRSGFTSSRSTPTNCSASGRPF